LRQAYDYWQDQPGSYSFPHYRQSDGATQPTKSFLQNGAAAPLAGEIRAKTPGCNSRVKPPTRSPATPFSPGTQLPIRAPLQGSVPPFGSAVVQCMFIPSALIHTLLGKPGPMSPALNPSPPSPDSEVAAPSLIIKRTSLTVIPALPPPPRSDIAPEPHRHHPLHAQNLKTTDQVPLRRVPLWVWPNV
jgi:hypothetical protein